MNQLNVPDWLKMGVVSLLDLLHLFIANISSVLGILTVISFLPQLHAIWQRGRAPVYPFTIFC
jgi:hypothetical protein